MSTPNIANNEKKLQQPQPEIAPGNGLLHYILTEVTFFRAHLFAFTIIPLIFSGIFFASNGRFPVKYIDSLFLCYSAMTVTGLSTVNLSTLTAWQQAILYILMMIGDITVVSWLMVLVRKRFFRTHCEYIAAKGSAHLRRPLLRRTRTALLNSISSPVARFRQQEPVPEKLPRELQPPPIISLKSPTPGTTLVVDSSVTRPSPLEPQTSEHSEPMLDDARTYSSSPRATSIQIESPTQMCSSPHAIDFGFASGISPKDAFYRRQSTFRDGIPYPRRGITILTPERDPTVPGSEASRKYQDLGGFPGPFQLIDRIFKRTAPRAYLNFERKMTLPIVSTQEEKKTPWLNFDLLVGRNSDFHTETLSDEQVEKIGGAEYGALRLLSYLIPLYFVGTQLISYLLFAPWLSTITTYDAVFEAQPREVKKPWFSLFQVMGSYTGGGMSLVDLGMLPFQEAYLMIFAMMFVILAGNHALPIFLRFVIWVASKISHEGSEAHQALSFLLDHPRRLYFAFDPLSLTRFSALEWGAFAFLDVGLQVYESIPLGPRVLSGLFQGLAARASGFSIVPLASFSPALQFLYVVMMYIAVYPVALSIRSTNVYEERSLGVFEAPPDDEDEEPDDLNAVKSRRERLGRYLGWHLRRQMSIDIWWLVWGVFFVAILERNNLMDESKKWFDLFRVLFELVSAFGGIGLSLGLPSDNFSFVGAMRPLSKLVVIVIMLRGRHRGLPVAVDRAVLLPNELVISREENQNKPAEGQSAPSFGAMNA
ncbi:potassium transporter [Cyathus striatus]|nr:potassium transporter [Cyathus striatus]